MPGRGGVLDVSCPRPSNCIAAGHYFTKFNRQSGDLAELWNGRTGPDSKPSG
jgi:hypothetical protein